jgi:hypothetical protein
MRARLAVGRRNPTLFFFFVFVFFLVIFQFGSTASCHGKTIPITKKMKNKKTSQSAALAAASQERCNSKQQIARMLCLKNES